MYHVDILGQQISVGDIILTKGPHSTNFDSIATVIKLNFNSITVSLQKQLFNYTDLTNYNQGVTKDIKLKKLRKQSSSVLVITDYIPQMQKTILSQLKSLNIVLPKRLIESDFTFLIHQLSYEMPWSIFTSPILNLSLDEVHSYMQQAIQDLTYQYPEYSI